MVDQPQTMVFDVEFIEGDDDELLTIESASSFPDLQIGEVVTLLANGEQVYLRIDTRRIYIFERRTRISYHGTPTEAPGRPSLMLKKS